MRLGYAYSRYPVLSQTFCDAEMLELERRGHEIVLGSLYPPKTDLRHEYLTKLRAPIHYAPSSRELDALARKAKKRGRWPEAMVRDHEQRFGAEYKSALRARNALFFVELFERERVPHFHVHFANRAAHTAMFVKAISGISFSVTAHGQDFMSDLGDDELLREICRAAEFVGAETNYSRDLLRARCPESAEKIFRVYNGLDLSRFPPAAEGRAEACRSAKTIRLLSVGRLVPFKGFDVLIDACAELGDLDYSCEIIGDGPLSDELRARAAERNVRVHFAGERSQKDVLAALQSCDLFVLAALLDERGASDVFPTVIAEAMACGKPVVSTTVAGIPELVANDETGLLVPPANASALADAIAQLGRDENLRARFGQAGRRRIEENFTIEKTIEPLLERFRNAVPSAIEESRSGRRQYCHPIPSASLGMTIDRGLNSGRNVAMTSKAIVLAGGAGSRLFPLTQIVCKQLLPVYDKPMICYPLATLMLGGLREILIISTPKDLPMLRAYLGDGSRLGIQLEYAEQAKPEGIAQAFIIGAKFIGDGGATLILGDNIFYGKLDFFRDALGLRRGGCIFAYQVRDPQRYGVVEFNESERAVSLEEKPERPRSAFAVPGLYVFDDRVVEYSRALKASARGELEITDLNLRYMRDGELRVKRLGRGIAWLDTGTPNSLLEASNYIATIEHRQGMKIACLEEIALRMGFIEQRELSALIDALPKGDYREYLKRVAQESPLPTGEA